MAWVEAIYRWYSKWIFFNHIERSLCAHNVSRLLVGFPVECEKRKHWLISAILAAPQNLTQRSIQCAKSFQHVCLSQWLSDVRCEREEPQSSVVCRVFAIGTSVFRNAEWRSAVDGICSRSTKRAVYGVQSKRVPDLFKRVFSRDDDGVVRLRGALRPDGVDEAEAVGEGTTTFLVYT